MGTSCEYLILGLIHTKQPTAKVGEATGHSQLWSHRDERGMHPLRYKSEDEHGYGYSQELQFNRERS